MMTHVTACVVIIGSAHTCRVASFIIGRGMAAADRAAPPCIAHPRQSVDDLIYNCSQDNKAFKGLKVWPVMELVHYGFDLRKVSEWGGDDRTAFV